MDVAERHVVVTALFALLPAANSSQLENVSASRLRERFERHLDILIGGSDRDAARAAARYVYEELQATGQFASLQLRRDSDNLKQIGLFYLQRPFNFLSDEARKELSSGDEKSFERGVLGRYYGLGGGLNSEVIERDPLLVLPDYLGRRGTALAGNLTLEDGYLSVSAEGQSFVLLNGELAASPFSIGLQQQLALILQSARTELLERFDGATMNIAGVLPHAIAGTTAARSEISSVGVGSMIGIVLLFLVVFRSLVPLCLTVVSIAIGCLGGLATCLILFGHVHLLTLVFGSCLIGISVDYSFHYFCDNFRSVDPAGRVAAHLAQHHAGPSNQPHWLRRNVDCPLSRHAGDGGFL